MKSSKVDRCAVPLVGVNGVSETVELNMHFRVPNDLKIICDLINNNLKSEFQAKGRNCIMTRTITNFRTNNLILEKLF